MAKKNILQLYNMCRDLVIQAEQSAEKNNGMVDESIIPILKETFTQIIEFEKVHLITSHDVFYGTMLLNMETKINFKQRGPLDIDVSKEPFLLKFNPMFIVHYTYSEFTALVVSEILKLTYAHPASFRNLNSLGDNEAHQLLEKSSQASVSNMVQNDIRLDKKESMRLRLPEDTYTTTKLSEEIGLNPKREQALEYYYKILQQYKDKSPQNSQPSQSPGGEGPGESNPNQIATRNNNNGEGVHQWEKNDADETQEKIKAMVGEVYNSLSEKERGTMPGNLVEQIEKLLKKPEINWKQVLRKYIGAIPVPHRSTRRRLNRRQPHRGDLSGKLPKRHIELVVAIDTSGSMSTLDIQYVINEIFSIVKDYDSKVTIIECDMTVGKVYEAKRANDVQTKVSGRGGTAFTPVIEYINEHNYRNALMIYFTDGYGESSIPKPRTYRNLWVVLEDEKYLSLEQPYGEVKALKKDADWIKQNQGSW